MHTQQTERPHCIVWYIYMRWLIETTTCNHCTQSITCIYITFLPSFLNTGGILFKEVFCPSWQDNYKLMYGGCWIMWPCYRVHITVWHFLFVYFVSRHCIHWAIPKSARFLFWNLFMEIRNTFSDFISVTCRNFFFIIISLVWPWKPN